MSLDIGRRLTWLRRSWALHSPLVCGAALWFAVGSSFADELPSRGVVKAVNHAALSTDIPLRVLKLPFREGERFRKGDVLIEFDCRRQMAEVEVAQAVVAEATLTVASNESLAKHKAIGQFDVEIARARLEKALGELKGLKARADDCIVRAPFSGRISELHVRALEFAQSQRPFLAIIDDNSFEIELIVSSARMAQLAAGQVITFRLDEIPDEPVEAVVTFVGASVDPVSKTGKIIARVQSGPAALAHGMSGTALFGRIAR